MRTVFLQLCLLRLCRDRTLFCPYKNNPNKKGWLLCPTGLCFMASSLDFQVKFIYNYFHMDATYSRNPDVIFRKIADEFILVPIRQKAVDLKCVYTLNQTAAFLWELIDSKQSVAQITDKFVAEFEVEPRQGQDDILEIISQLESLSLIKRV